MLSGGDVPDVRAVVNPMGDEEAAVRAEADLREDVTILEKRASRLARRRVVETCRLVSPGCCDPLAIGAERHVVDDRGLIFERYELLPVNQRPHGRA